MHLATSLLRAGRSFCITAIASVALLLHVASNAATVPAGFSDSTTASGLSSPTAMEIAPDGRIFVAEQTGALRVIKDGVLLPTPFLTLSVNSSGERGLIGVAFGPDFASNRDVYVYYTTSASPIHNRISRFTASIDNPDVAEPGETVLLDLENLGAWNHNGGALHFGVDGDFTSPRAITRWARTRSPLATDSARYCASTLTVPSPQTTRSTVQRPVIAKRSGRAACAIPSPSQSSPVPVG